MFRRRKLKPVTEYERQCWSSEALERWKYFRRLINPQNRNLLVYYPGSGGETTVSRAIAAAIQVQVNTDYEHLPEFELEKTSELEHRMRTYKSQWLKVIDYLGDAFCFFPPEIKKGVDVLVDKCSLYLINRPLEVREKFLDLIRTGGFLIADNSLDHPRFNLILEEENRESCKGEPFHLRIYHKLP